MSKSITYVDTAACVNILAQIDNFSYFFTTCTFVLKAIFNALW